jgi:hypothetical protein
VEPFLDVDGPWIADQVAMNCVENLILGLRADPKVSF